MFNLIIKALKRVGIKMILNEVHIDSYLNYYRVDFLDRFDNWCRLTIFYNETDLFVDNSVRLIGNGRREIYSDRVINSIEMKGKFEDFIKSKSKVPDKKELDKFFEDKLIDLVEDIKDLNVADFNIKEVKFYTSPSLMFFIHFTYKKARYQPIKCFVGDKISYNEDLEGLDILINKIEEVLCYDKLFGFDRPR